MSTEKLSELSKPVAYTDADELRFHHATSDMWPVPLGFGKDVPLYSQEYVSALLAELEFEKQNNAGVAGMVEDYETKLDAKDTRIAELEAKMATPVRLLGEMLAHDWEHSTERQATFQHRKIAWDARLAEDKKAILAAGFTFTVEGDV